MAWDGPDSAVPSDDNSLYTGRFAPSPTGLLHFGSLLAAIASYAEARQRSGRWLVRMEDIDPPRQVAGADAAILAQLEDFGFEWDGPVTYQSQWRERHEAVIDALRSQGMAYHCSCTRKDLARAPQGPLGPVYPGTCRKGSRGRRTAVRVLVDDRDISFVDRLQGPVKQSLRGESGDFVIRRRDGLIAYNLAVVVDDADQQITEVIRGADLIDSTPRHLYLQQVLGLRPPEYAHIPLAVNRRGQKLSKTTGAVPIRAEHANRLLYVALEALGQLPPVDLRGAGIGALWQWTFENWRLEHLAGQKSVPVSSRSFD